MTLVAAHVVNRPGVATDGPAFRTQDANRRQNELMIWPLTQISWQA